MKPFQASFLIVFLLIFGCDRGQQMLKPVMSEKPVTEQPTTDETPGTDIFTDIDLPPEPTIPEGADILDTDRVYHDTSAELQQNREEYGTDFVMVDTAQEAYQSEVVTNLFNDTKEWAEEYCGSNSVGDAPEHVFVHFRIREEREIFKNSLPGTWATNQLDMDDHWWLVRDWVTIIDQTDVYYTVRLDANWWDPCVFRNQPE